MLNRWGKVCLTRLRTVWPPPQLAAPSITTDQSFWITQRNLNWVIVWSVGKAHKERRWLDISGDGEGILRSGQTRLNAIALFHLQVANFSFSAALSQTIFFPWMIWKWGGGIYSDSRSRHNFSHLSSAYKTQPVAILLNQKHHTSLWLANAPNNIMLLSTNKTKI